MSDAIEMLLADIECDGSVVIRGVEGREPTWPVDEAMDAECETSAIVGTDGIELARRPWRAKRLPVLAPSRLSDMLMTAPLPRRPPKHAWTDFRPSAASASIFARSSSRRKTSAGVGHSLIRMAQPKQAQRQLAVRIRVLEYCVGVGGSARREIDGGYA
eukprot:scaffold224224_cov28-Tisochrysis_lutea.AAC.13